MKEVNETCIVIKYGSTAHGQKRAEQFSCCQYCINLQDVAIGLKYEPTPETFFLQIARVESLQCNNGISRGYVLLPPCCAKRSN